MILSSLVSLHYRSAPFNCVPFAAWNCHCGGLTLSLSPIVSGSTTWLTRIVLNLNPLLFVLLLYRWSCVLSPILSHTYGIRPILPASLLGQYRAPDRDQRYVLPSLYPFVLPFHPSGIEVEYRRVYHGYCYALRAIPQPIPTFNQHQTEKRNPRFWFYCYNPVLLLSTITARV